MFSRWGEEKLDFEIWTLSRSFDLSRVSIVLHEALQQLISLKCLNVSFDNCFENGFPISAL